MRKSDMADGNGYTTESRITSLESHTESLNTRMRELADAVKTQGDHLFDAIQKLSDRMTAQTRPQWGVYFAGLSVLLTFCIAIGSAALAPVYILTKNNYDENQQQQVYTQRIDQQLQEHMLKGAHPAAEARLIALETDHAMVKKEFKEQLRQLDEVLQREMRQLDDIERTRIDQLDERLQREMNLIAHAQTVDVQHLREKINGVKEDLDEHEDEFIRQVEKLDSNSVERDSLQHERFKREVEMIGEAEKVRVNALQKQLDALRREFAQTHNGK